MAELIHQRGIELAKQRDAAGPLEYEWVPLCSTREDPQRGEVTTEAHKVTCPACCRILRISPPPTDKKKK